MIFHVVSLPHTNVTSDYVACAFTEKVRKFCDMMKSLGHTVYLYAGTQCDAECDELITCISEEERVAFLDGNLYLNVNFDYTLPTWQNFNARAIKEIEKRAGDHDFLCVIGGAAHKQIADALPHLTCVEFGIGYGGTFSRFRVFESNAWMHTIYGTSNHNANELDGNFFDAVIPNSFEPEKFPYARDKEDYFLFVGRLTERKGYQIAADVCEAAGQRLIVAGAGTPPAYGEYVGLVNEDQRGALMSRAKALFVPTQYIEPFGGVAVEAMMCGTPVITTDWGAFTETNIQGVTGYRCRSFGEFLEATTKVEDLHPYEIREIALAKYSVDVVKYQYQDYFERLDTLWNEGWYTRKSWL